MITSNYKQIILTGCILWIVGFFLAAATIYPYCLVGIYLGPPILITGIFGWIVNYKRTKNRLPNPFSALNQVLSKHKGFLNYHIAMFDFMLTYLLHFWTFCIAFWIIMTIIGTSILKNSNSFNIAKKYVESDSKLIDEIGEIKYYGLLIGGSISSNGNADISFSIIGEKNTVDVNSKITSDKVVGIDYRY